MALQSEAARPTLEQRKGEMAKIFREILNHDTYQGKPFIPIELPIKGTKGVDRYYPPLLVEGDENSYEQAFVIHQRQFPTDMIGHKDPRTGYSVMVWLPNLDESKPDGMYKSPPYLKYTEFTPPEDSKGPLRYVIFDSGKSIEIPTSKGTGMMDSISEFMTLMQGAMRTDGSSTDLSRAKLDGSMWVKSVGKGSAEVDEANKFEKLFENLLAKETHSFHPSDYIDQLERREVVDLSRHALAQPLVLEKLNPKSKGEYQGYTLPEVSISNPDGGYTVRLVQIIKSPQGEPIELGLNLIVKSAPKLLTPKAIPIDSEGKTLLPGFVYRAPHITEIFNVTDVLTGGGDRYVVLRGNRQLSDPYPGTQLTHKERYPLFALSRLNRYMDAMLGSTRPIIAPFKPMADIIRDIRHPKS